jgi:hypothetical protein
LTVRTTSFALVAVVMAWLAVPAARADIQLSIRDGRVVLVANDASIADIMAEWARLGHTKIVNADKLPKDVVTLELRNVNERQALDILLRATSGFIAALRDVSDPNASLFDRIVVMPPSVAPPPTVNASAAPQNPRLPAQAMPVQEPPPQLQAAAEVVDPPDDLPPPVMVESALPERPPAAFTSNNTRHMMETLDPRNFRLPPGAVMTMPAGAMPPPVGSSTRPGVIGMPTPNSP